MKNNDYPVALNEWWHVNVQYVLKLNIFSIVCF